MTGEMQAASYSSPPIIEAVFEIRLAEIAADPKLKKASDWVSKRYATNTHEQVVQAKFDFQTRTTTFIDQPAIRKLASADQTDALHMSGQSLAWIRRAPYEGWDQFNQRIEAELPLALKALTLPRIARLGLRYINRIDVPAKEGVLYHEDYLKFRIELDPLLEPTNYFQWVVGKHFPEDGLKVLVQSAVVESEIPNKGAFAFDIDVFCDEDVPQSIDQIQKKLASMRLLKNTIFEAGITSRARELYAS